MPRTPYTADLRLSQLTMQRHETLPFRGDLLLRQVPHSQGVSLKIGQRVEGLMSLRPISLPWEPGGYPLSQDLFFRGIGAEGTLRGGIAFLGEPEGGFREGHRNEISVMLRRNFTPPIDGLLMALVLGDKTLVPLRIRDHFSYQRFGAPLAISGLHMTLVAAFSSF